MASINDLATAATIASSAVALKEQATNQPTPSSSPPSPSPPLEEEDPSSPPSPSPSAQLQAQAQEAHAQQSKESASRSPAPPEEEEEEEAPSLSPSPDDRTPSTPGRGGAATAASTTSAPDCSSITVHVGGATSVVTPKTPTPTPTPGPVLAAPQISPQNPAQATIPPRLSPEMAPGKNGGAEADKEDGMVGVEYESELRKPPVRGAFIVFEGMDRAGKTTQAKLLQLRCIESGREVRFMRFPDRTTPIGQMIDSYLKGQAEIEDHVIHLLFSANRWEAAKKIKTELEAGHTVICDRFYHSGIVYSAAKQLASLSLSWAKAPELGLPRPDMVLFLDLEEAVARSRGGWGGEVYEKGEMQRRVRELFWGLSMGDLGTAVSTNKAAGGAAGGGTGNGGGKGPSAARGPFGNGSNSSNARDREAAGAETEGEFRQEEEDIQIVDADLGVEELADKVWEVVRGRLEAVERGEEGRTVRTVR
ncbi:thymidylate kinase-domain-containing protein [Hypoxylon argillaceum]|nr:thymidylate kinase-domain-containing protein [Hypoxylon argillaceum]